MPSPNPSPQQMMPVMDGLECICRFRKWEQQHRPDNRCPPPTNKVPSPYQQGALPLPTGALPPTNRCPPCTLNLNPNPNPNSYKSKHATQQQ